MPEREEPIFDVAQLAHVELGTPDLERSAWFFRELLGLEESLRTADSIYLRAYEDWYHHTLKLTAAPEPGLGHIAWRATSPAALARRVAALEQSGAGLGWLDGEPGHGPAYQFRTPDGHRMEILWEVEYFTAPRERRSPLISRPQMRPTRGVPVRRIDHVNCFARDVRTNREFMMDVLGFRHRERKVKNDGTEVGAWLSVSPLTHEIAIMHDASGARARFHHLCYWYGVPQHLLDLADLCVERGIEIESGPGRHGTTQGHFLYLYEPGGNRIEAFGDVGYLIFDPAWEPVTWGEEDLPRSSNWYEGSMPSSFYNKATPSLEMLGGKVSPAPPLAASRGPAGRK